MITPSLFPIEATLTPAGPRLECVDGRTWIFRLARPLRSLNVTLGAHWRVKAVDTEAWEHELRGAIAALSTSLRLDGFVPGTLPAWSKLRHQRERRRVQVIRFVPSPRNFIRDDDNLVGACKGLRDAMKRVGLIHDDAREWLVMPVPRQQVSSAGEFSTVVQLDRPDTCGAWR